MHFEHGFKSLLLAGIGMTLVSIFAKPVITILLLPINLITFGFFRWIASGFVLYIVTLLVKDFKINKFIFGGLANKWIVIPPVHFEGLLAFIGFAFLVSVISSFIYWLIK
jgi:uncharacterized membrane protein YvlD (DUF360 family)